MAPWYASYAASDSVREKPGKTFTAHTCTFADLLFAAWKHKSVLRNVQLYLLRTSGRDGYRKGRRLQCSAQEA